MFEREEREVEGNGGDEEAGFKVVNGQRCEGDAGEKRDDLGDAAMERLCEQLHVAFNEKLVVAWGDPGVIISAKAPGVANGVPAETEREAIGGAKIGERRDGGESLAQGGGGEQANRSNASSSAVASRLLANATSVATRRDSGSRRMTLTLAVLAKRASVCSRPVGMR